MSAAAEDPAWTSLVSGSFSSSSSFGDGEQIDSVAVKLCLVSPSGFVSAPPSRGLLSPFVFSHQAGQSDFISMKLD